jgi:sugar phosphate isomerase/epimerase
MINLRIGNQTSFAAHGPAEPFEYALSSRFDAFEWFPDKKENGRRWDTGDISIAMRSEIKNRARSAGMTMSVHVPWHANPLDHQSRALILENVVFAKEIGAGIVNIHLYTEAGIRTYVEAILPIIEETKKAGMRLSIENTPLTSPEDFNRVFSVLRKMRLLGRGWAGMCFDMGHANLYAASMNNYINFIDLIEPHVPIIHIHAHENFGDSDSHLTLFTGPAGQNDSGIRELLQRLKERDFSGCLILEQWPEPRYLLNQARERLRALWQEIGKGQTKITNNN